MRGVLLPTPYTLRMCIIFSNGFSGHFRFHKNTIKLKVRGILLKNILKALSVSDQIIKLLRATSQQKQ